MCDLPLRKSPEPSSPTINVIPNTRAARVRNLLLLSLKSSADFADSAFYRGLSAIFNAENRRDRRDNPNGTHYATT
jgi:hypothetical protein